MIDNFMKNAKGLAKNPLGIIALFISLIYGFACLVMSVAAEKLEPNEKIPLIWFLIIFPIIVLAVFVYLVIFHHKKLYSPSDFRDDKSFLETFDKNQKIIDEFQETEEPAPTRIKENKPKSRPQINQLEFNDFRDKYIEIENLVLERVENIYCSPIKRNVRIKGLPRAEFDGVITKEDEVIFIEIKYIKSLTMSSNIIDSLKRINEQLKEYKQKGYLERKVTFLIYIVFEVERLEFLFNQINNLEKELQNRDFKILIFKDHYLSLKKQKTTE